MPGKPRILHVIDNTIGGGAQAMLRDILRTFRDRYFFSVVVLGRQGHYSDAYRDLGIPVYPLGESWNRWNPRPVVGLIRLIRAQQFSLVHAVLERSAVLAAVAARATGARLILHDQGGMYPEALRFLMRGGPVRRLYLWAYRWAVARCDRVLVLTNLDADGYRRFYALPENKLVVLPNAVDPVNFERKDASHGSGLRQELGLSDAAPLVVMVGRLVPVKDWMTFLAVAEATQKARGTSCTFVAVGSGEEGDSLSREVQSRGLDNVRFVGERHDVPAILRDADVFLLTSRRESFGIVVIEAMASDCPVVATRSGGPGEIIANGVDGLLADVGDFRGLAECVWRLLDEKTLRSEIIKAARKKIAERYSLAVFAGQLATVYDDVLRE